MRFDLIYWNYSTFFRKNLSLAVRFLRFYTSYIFPKSFYHETERSFASFFENSGLPLRPRICRRNTKSSASGFISLGSLLLYIRLKTPFGCILLDFFTNRLKHLYCHFPKSIVSSFFALSLRPAGIKRTKRAYNIHEKEG